MQIVLTIKGEKKTFSAPFIPMAARRKYFELGAISEEKERDSVDKGEPFLLSSREQMEDDDEMLSILSNIVFKDQFTLDELYHGASKPYIDEKLTEAIFGKKRQMKKSEQAGNNLGE
ncbi:hypothetical protein JMA_22160 [Jeotgalibacillus malaysiensis]|uniref:Phage protein n=1 Tax=Jeotgalibacillus malaysiensis TaxID=1508404 RepID=A0A0B5ASJ5_9BACL|nr:hypothetical protein [Jeotgalibacillus malaysiensis]AJD91533.1 hypothetical protein JMA_22160 [Jeotgalibacillus malaysiensis]